jgi:hypothetical protein
MKDFKNKIALVTGGNSGIGLSWFYPGRVAMPPEITIFELTSA